MDLLKPQEARSLAEQNTIREIEKAKEIRILVKDYEEQRQKSERAFESALTAQRETWAKEEEEHRGRLVRVRGEMENAEERTRIARIPLTARAIELDNREREVAIREQVLNENEEGNEARRILLMDRLNEASERDSQLDAKKKRLDEREKGIEANRSEVAFDAKKLGDMLTSFFTDKKAFEAVVASHDAEYAGKAVILAEREKRVALREAADEERKVALDDREETITRAFDELRKKQHG